jgi:hypothetical protein
MRHMTKENIDLFLNDLDDVLRPQRSQIKPSIPTQ